MSKQSKRWYDLHPTMNEMEKMLLKAGLPLDPSEWTTEQAAKAAEILNNQT